MVTQKIILGISVIINVCLVVLFLGKMNIRIASMKATLDRTIQYS